MRARQIQRRDEDLEEIVIYLCRNRMQGKEYFDVSHQIRPEKVVDSGDLVLLYDFYGIIDMSSSRKLRYR